ncbi:hypothetical protein AB833_14105 [Chromatiales bacterium (ex Bugula neritina AB1)]|nr:hypothetical protein AB833_14105 [Chromatiales bacterium (ex Bugula neritina AB1)]
MSSNPDRAYCARERPFAMNPVGLDSTSDDAEANKHNAGEAAVADTPDNQLLLNNEDYHRLVMRLQNRIELLESQVKATENSLDREARRVRIQRKLVNYLRHRVGDQGSELKEAQAKLDSYATSVQKNIEEPVRDVRVQSLRGALMRIGGVAPDSDLAEPDKVPGPSSYGKIDASEFLPVEEAEQPGIFLRIIDALGAIRRALVQSVTAKVPA